MSKKAKYSTTGKRTDGSYEIQKDGKTIAQGWHRETVRIIARALNAMEAKPKAKPFAFDWKWIDERYKYAAMDECLAWYVYETKPKRPVANAVVWPYGDYPTAEFVQNRPPYPGDWRESLQERPTK